MPAPRAVAIVLALLGLTAIAVLVTDEDPKGWNSARDPVARYALAYIYERAARADDTRVIISQPVTEQQLDSIGLSISPDADQPGDQHLVVITGDLDLAGLAPGWGRFTETEPRSYIAHVLDTSRRRRLVIW